MTAYVVSRQCLSSFLTTNIDGRGPTLDIEYPIKYIKILLNLKLVIKPFLTYWRCFIFARIVQPRYG